MSSHKFTATEYDSKGRYVRYFRGITRDYRISGGSGGYTVQAEAWTAINQMPMYRVILSRNLAGVWKKIDRIEEKTAAHHGTTEIQPRTADHSIIRAINRLTA
jgi:hypothetical protein